LRNSDRQDAQDAYSTGSLKMLETNARGILLDIEGTTSSISFVYDVMFRYVRENVDSFLKSNWGQPSVAACLPMLAVDLEKDSVDDWLGGLSDEQQQSAVSQSVIGLMDADVKATGLKQLHLERRFHQLANGGSSIRRSCRLH